MIDGQPVLAPRLHALGVVNKLVADGSALDAALQWADAIAQQSANAVDRIKLLIREAGDNPLTRQFSAEQLHLVESLNHPDAQEGIRSEEHTSEVQSLMRISYAVFCLKKKTK